jgi:cholesterol oxidase
MIVQFDDVIIGSGFGGAVLALRLAERYRDRQERRICVMERGQEYPPPQRNGYATNFLEVTEHGVWNESLGKFGILEYLKFPKIDIIQGSGVGGGSLHFYNVSARGPRQAFDDPRWPDEITYDELSPYYKLVEEKLSVTPIRPTPDNPFLPTKTVAFLQAVYSAGGSANLLPLAVNFGQRPDSSDREVCDHRGECFIGCRANAKNSLDLNYLKEARELGVRITSMCKVIKIQAFNGGYKILVRRLGGEPTAGFEEVVATRVFLAAGCLGSTECLLRSKYCDRHPLNRLSDTLGKHFSANGDYLFAGTMMPLGVDVVPTAGPSITAGAEFMIEGVRVFVEDCGVGNTLRILLGKTIREDGRFLRLLQNYLRGELTPGEKAELNSEGMPGPVRRFLPYLAMIYDNGNGTIQLNDTDELNVDWPYEENAPLYDKVRTLIRDISNAAGGKYVENLWERNHKSFTAHPLGGCVMGVSPDDSVVDPNGKVHNYDNLYVVDGSIIPAPIGINPSLTIAALAERIAANLPE